MVHLTIPPGDYSIRPRGNQVEIFSLDRDLTREEVAAQLGRSERSIDLYRSLEGAAQLKSRRTGGRIYIRESELARWLAYMETNPDEYTALDRLRNSASDRPRKKRRTRLDNRGRSESRTNAKAPTGSNGAT